VKKDKIIIYLLFALLALYFMQGVLYQSGSTVSQFTLLCIFAISFIYFIISLFHKKDAFYFFWMLLLIINSVYFIVTGHYGDYWFQWYKNILFINLLYYPFYYFASKGALVKKDMLALFVMSIPVAIAQWFVYFVHREIIADASSLSTNDITNNASYFFALLIPFVFLFNKKRQILAWLSVAFLFYFVLIGAKRGAILVALMSILCFLRYQLKRSKVSAKTILGVLTGIVVVVIVAITIYQNNEYLQYRFEETQTGNSSSRDYIYTRIFNKWANADAINMLFGFGFIASYQIAGNFAHNDWLELLSSCGLLGGVTYLLLFISAFMMILKAQWTFEKKWLCLTVISIWLAMTLFSMFYCNEGRYPLIILLAYLLSSKSKSLENV
jgi:O-antigen ligase